MGVINLPSRSAVPPAAVTRILSRFSRQELEGFIAVAIDLMDLADGDADLENATDMEDDFQLSPHALGYAEGRGPGCPISDQDTTAWLEWHTRGRHKLERGHSEPTGRNHYGSQLLEDDEDDDPGGCEHDGREPEERFAATYGIDQRKPIDPEPGNRVI